MGQIFLKVILWKHMIDHKRRFPSKNGTGSFLWMFVIDERGCIVDMFCPWRTIGLFTALTALWVSICLMQPQQEMKRRWCGQSTEVVLYIFLPAIRFCLWVSWIRFFFGEMVHRYSAICRGICLIGIVQSENPLEGGKSLQHHPNPPPAKISPHFSAKF